MKKLTLQITKENFDTILSGEQKVEHRRIYPSNEKRYMFYRCNGVDYKNESDVPDDGSEVEFIPVHYDALYLINGRRKDAPRLLVEVVKADIYTMTDEEGNIIYYNDGKQDFADVQIWYTLGKVLETENIK